MLSGQSGQTTGLNLPRVSSNLNNCVTLYRTEKLLN